MKYYRPICKDVGYWLTHDDVILDDGSDYISCDHIDLTLYNLDIRKTKNWYWVGNKLIGDL